MGDVTRIRKTRREALREELASRNYLSQLHDYLDIDWYMVLTDNDGQVITNEAGDVQFIDKTREFTAKTNILLKLLGKSLPDLAAIRLEDSEGKPLPQVTYILSNTG